MNYQRHFFLLLSLFVLTACSGKQSEVKLQISHNFVFGGPQTAAVAAGGLMVWGHNTLGAAFGKTLEDTDTLNLQLAPGTWTFYVMAWDGTKDYVGDPSSNVKFGGTVRCGKSVPTVLSGGSAKVDLSLNNVNCIDPVFKGSANTPTVGGNYNLAPFQPVFCSNGSLATGGGDICADTFTDTRKVSERAPIASYRVVMKNFNGPPGARNFQPGGLAGECVAFQPDPAGGSEPDHRYGLSMQKVPNLPAGGPNLPFIMEVEMFPGSVDCDMSTDRRGAIIKRLPNGVASATPDSKYFTDPANDIHRHYLTVSPSMICEGRRTTDMESHKFAAGLGTQTNPYILCSVPQFHAINDPSDIAVNVTRHYKLQSNLDFNPFSKGLVASALPPIFNCLEIGTNFLPIGAMVSCSGSTLVWNTPANFTGSFEGSGFTMNGLRFRTNDNSNVGIFAKVYGSGISIRNLNIENMELEAKHMVGAVAGSMIGTTPAVTDIELTNIKIKNLDIRGRQDTNNSYAGGVAGKIDYGTVKNIFIEKSELEADELYVGGLFGNVQHTNMKNISAELSIRVNSPGAPQWIGGIAGFMGGGSNLDYGKFEGAIYTNGSKVGGLVGEVGTSTSVTNVYTIAHVMTNQSATNVNIGGLFGVWNSSGTVGPGYSLSLVKSECTTGCIQGAIVGLKSTAPTTQDPIIKLDPANSGHHTGNSFTSEQTFSIADIRAPHGDVASALPHDPDPFVHDWKFVASEYPRFDFEKHFCSQPYSGAGTEMVPKPICNESQYLGIEGDTGTHYKLYANIRLPDFGTNSEEFTAFSKHLNGNELSLIGGSSSPSGPGTAHITNLTGSITNLKIHGMSRTMTTPASDTDPNAVFVGNNAGILQGIDAHFYGNFNSHSALLAAENTGTIKDIFVDGKLVASGSTPQLLAPIVYKNFDGALITGTSSSNDINCISTVCDKLAGFAVLNDGDIKASEVRSRMHANNSGYVATNFSMIVDHNMDDGLIEDFYVSDETKFETYGATAYYFHRFNEGILSRVANFAELNRLNTDYATSITGFPTTASNALPGTHSFVFRHGGKSGKKIFEKVPFQCTSSTVLALSGSDWSTKTDYTTAYGDSAYTALTASDKKLVVHVEMNGTGFKFTQGVNSLTSSNSRFTIPVGICPSGQFGKVTLYWTDDRPVNSGGGMLPGVLLPQTPLTATYLGSNWYNNHAWDTENDLADQAAMMSFHAYFLGITSTPVTPPAWEINDEGMQLFEKH